MTRVLYVDDEPDIREIAELALSLDPDFDVRLAGSAREALTTIAQWRPDIVLLDVMMPEIDGPTLLNMMRQREDLADIPVIFVTARAQQSELQNFATLDAVGVIAKPFDPMSLAAQVRHLLA